MNTQIIIYTFIALITGAVGGTIIGSHISEPKQADQPIISTDTVTAADFVSLRPLIDNLPTDTVSETELQDLIFMREEEKLARDVYQTLYEKWQLPIFNNIAHSEQTHTEAIRDLLIKYDISDPVSDDTIGSFTNTDLQALYKNLVETGLTSIEDALAVGALIEELDIKDITEAIARTDNSDIVTVYENLLRGSRNHLRSFHKQLVARGITYKPQYITEDEFNTIVSEVIETGKGRNQSRGWGN